MGRLRCRQAWSPGIVKMSLCQALPWFVFLCATVGGILAHNSSVSLFTGIAVGLAVGISPVFLLGAIVGLMLAWSPQRPFCICGKCKSEEYDFVGPMHQAEDNAYYYKCPHCGREYRSKDSAFDLKTVHGYSPYMEKSVWQRWKKNTQQKL